MDRLNNDPYRQFDSTTSSPESSSTSADSSSNSDVEEEQISSPATVSHKIKFYHSLAELTPRAKQFVSTWFGTQREQHSEHQSAEDNREMASPSYGPAMSSTLRYPSDNPATEDNSNNGIPHPNDEMETVVPPKQEMFARLTMNDSNIAPPKFEGSDQDTERAEQWLASFKSYAKLRSLSRSAQAHYFALLMSKDAAIWFHSLPVEVSQDIRQLQEEFAKRFSLTVLDR